MSRLSLAAVLVSILLLSLPVTQALTTISYVSTTGTPLGGGSSLDPDRVVNRQIIVERSGGIPVTYTVVIDVTATDHPVETVYIYTCGAADPIACADSPVTADEFAGAAHGEYPWNNIRVSQGSPYPEVAHLMTFVQSRDDAGNEIWLGFWDKVTRTSSSMFEVNGDALGGITLTIDPSLLPTINDFIDGRQMVPFNPGWVSRAEFPDAASLQTIGSSDLETPVLSTAPVSGQSISSPLIPDYTFVFPETDAGFSHPITLQNNPPYVCGNGVREPEKGEGEATCCYDFGCPASGQYCDTGSGICTAESAIRLELVSPQRIGVADCSIENTVDVQVDLLNPPGGLSILSTTYDLAGESFTAGCAGGAETGYRYTCTLTIPSQAGNPACESGSLTLGPNSLTFSIDYNDGPATVQNTLETALPDVVIASYTIGDGRCDADLGEDLNPRSCYDCGCAAGQYCDSSSPASGVCRARLTDSSLRITDISPTHFAEHRPSGDTVTLTAEITAPPETLAVGSATCSVSCASDQGACEASCALSCSETASATVHAESCSLTFAISNYDETVDYSLTPAVDMPVSYEDGSAGTITETLSSSGFALITVGSSFCGDGIAGEGETEATCCFDAGCSTGYCDTQRRGVFTPGDACRDDAAITADLELLPGQSLQFIDADRPHQFFLGLQVANKPSGLTIAPDCEFGGQTCGPGWFGVSCEEMGSTADTYNGTCTVNVSAMDYQTSPFFDPVANDIVIEPNTIILDFAFTDGPGKAQKHIGESLPRVTIVPLASCGNGNVEFELGETAETCCVDTGCGILGENYFCYTGAAVNGECREATEIGVVIEGIDPDVIDCQIDRLDQKCQTFESIDVTLRILTPPEDLVIESSSYYTFEDKDTTVDFCSQPDEEGRLTCSFVLEPQGTTTPGTEAKQLTINLVGSYTLESGKITEVFPASKTIEIRAFKSAALASTEDKIAGLDAKIGKLQRTRNIVLAVLAAGAAFCTAECVADITKVGCKTCWVIWSCGAGVTLPLVGYFLDQAEKMKAQRLELEAAIGSGDYSSFGSGMDSIYYTTAGTIGLLVCTLGLGGFGGGGATQTQSHSALYTKIVV